MIIPKIDLNIVLYKYYIININTKGIIIFTIKKKFHEDF